MFIKKMVSAYVFVISLFTLGIRVILALDNEFGSIPSLLFMEWFEEH
jgi:hypothetical protein